MRGWKRLYRRKIKATVGTYLPLDATDASVTNLPTISNRSRICPFWVKGDVARAGRDVTRNSSLVKAKYRCPGNHVGRYHKVGAAPIRLMRSIMLTNSSDLATQIDLKNSHDPPL